MQLKVTNYKIGQESYNLHILYNKQIDATTALLEFKKHVTSQRETF